MTGYGAGESGAYRVEVRSTNHKNLYIQLNLPSYLYFYEPEIRTLVKEKFKRGYIELFFSKLKMENIKLKINRPLAEEYYQTLVSLKNELSIHDTVGINILAQQKDIFYLEEPEVEIPVFRETLESALEELKKTRIQEGKNLADDINKRIQLLSDNMSVLEDKRMDFITNAKTVLTERLKDLLEDHSIEESRLIQEVAILVERSDITEEIVRIKSHLKHLKDVLAQSDVVGKKAGFIVQELHRELTTINSKSPDITIASLIVDMKYEVEKIREQIQNLQ
ncbi:MAG: YicC family protein [Thermodesulfovibrionia bacterium]|nr:YicC family protein [Thermodesulfovibrionia bacterium]